MPGSHSEAPGTAENGRLKLREAVLAAAVVGAIALGGGCSGDGVQSPEPSGAESAESSERSLTADAQEFLDLYGSRFDDPVATYHANEAYAFVSDYGAILEDGYISDYDPEVRDGAQSVLGFETYSLDLSIEPDHRLMVEIFNGYMADQMTLYMNALSKNPNAGDVVDDQFREYCSFDANTSTNAAFRDDDKYIANLMSTLGSLVQAYGSNSNYKVLSTEEDDGQSSEVLEGHPLLRFDEDGNIQTLDDQAHVVVMVETFDRDGESEIAYETLTMQLIVTIQPRAFSEAQYTEISIGELK